MALIRFILGKPILFFNWLFSPRSTRRDPEAQVAIDEQTASAMLCQYEACLSMANSCFRLAATGC